MNPQEAKMKKTIFLALFLVLIQSGFPEYVGKMYVNYDTVSAKKIRALSIQAEELHQFLEREMARGNLVLKKSEADSFIAGLEHRRYAQHHLGLPVFGGEIIQHLLNNSLVHANGHYYQIDQVDLVPGLSTEEAVSVFQRDLEDKAILEKPEDVSQVIFPLDEGDYRLCYQIKLKKDNVHYEIGYVDSDTGKILARDTNVVFEQTASSPGASTPSCERKTSTRQELEATLRRIFGLSGPGLSDNRQDSRPGPQGEPIMSRTTHGASQTNAENEMMALRARSASSGGDEIGLGIDYHGYQRKLPTYKENNLYYLYDDGTVRPYVQGVFDYRLGLYVPSDTDNYWDQDGTNVSAHGNVGLVYDFYYFYLGRNGMDNGNMDTLIVTHNSESSDNACWNGISLNFFVSGNQQAQYAAALDVVSHEFSHGVTDYASDLIYEFQPGALNESFSDIMACAAEFFWHPLGTGLYHAEWLVGEDAFPAYEYAVSRGYVRSLEDPNQFSQTGWYLGPDPCHLSQYYSVPFDLDRGGVHINMTIYPHAYYLLAAGGTNRVSGISVSGIGLEKATKIFYRAWVYYLTQTSIFVDAANAILQSAYDLYGGSSNEFAQAKQAMRAIGWIVS